MKIGAGRNFFRKLRPAPIFLARVLNRRHRMPRRPRLGTAGTVFHLLNRGTRRMRLFESADDYYQFLALLARAQRRTPVETLAYCLMPNHFHLVIRPTDDGQLSRFMHWLSSAHAQRWQAAHDTRGFGHVYQGRFKSIPVQSDSHFLRLCRYVERNPLPAGLVSRAEDWLWSSLSQRAGLRRPVRLDPWPVAIPKNWNALVNEDVDPRETEVIRQAIRRGAPYGAEGWREQMATTLGIVGSIRPVGRPRKSGPGVIS